MTLKGLLSVLNRCTFVNKLQNEKDVSAVDLVVMMIMINCILNVNSDLRGCSGTFWVFSLFQVVGHCCRSCPGLSR